MNDQWQELKETIIEMRDNDGTGTQQEVCKFLVNYMEILEKQIQECEVLDKIRAEIQAMSTDYCGGYIGLDKQEVMKIIDKYRKEER